MSAKSLGTVLMMAVGLEALAYGLACMIDPVSILVQEGEWGRVYGGTWSKVCTAAGVPCLLIALGSWLIFRPPLWLLRSVPLETAPTQAGSNSTASTQAHMILVVGMMLIGVNMLATAGPRLVGDLAAIGRWPQTTEFRSNPTWWWTMLDTVDVVLAIYLLLGAPLFSRWLMKRIRQSCAEAGETNFRDAE